MTPDTAALGSRQDSAPAVVGGRILWPSRPRWPWRRRSREMADVAYVLVVVGGFVLLALALRGLERL